MKRALIYTSVASMIDQFNMKNIEVLIDLGYKVEVACNFKDGSTISNDRIIKLQNKLHNINVEIHHIPIPRNITAFNSIYSSYKLTKELIEFKRFDLIHCHSPIGGVIARIANNKIRKHKARMIYTAHGFHFHKTAPIKNWLIYFPIEKALSKITDTLITINQEDYKRAKMSFNAKEIKYIPGVGVDLEKINEIKVNKKEYKKNLGIPEDAFVVLSVGEVNENKNHQVIIDSLSKINAKDIYYIICGIGPLKDNLIKLSFKKGLKERVKLLGYRTDVIELCKISDIFAFPSKREGLGLAALEAMATGLPLITSNVHGIVDYSINNKSGFSLSPTNIKGFKESIEKIYYNKDIKYEFYKNNLEYIKKFDVKNVAVEMKKIYRNE